MNAGSIFGMNGENPAVSSKNPETKSEKAHDGLGKDAFLKILITQLRHQNPLEPVKDQDFIAQMAQFSSLEQMQDMNQNLQANLAVMKSMGELMAQEAQTGFALGLIGHEVAYLGETGLKIGIVSGLKMHAGLPTIMVGEEALSFDQITEIQPAREEGAEVDG